MGSTVFFIMASERPEYQSKIRSQISLGPVAYLYKTKSPTRYFAPYIKWLNVSLVVSCTFSIPTSHFKSNKKIIFYETVLCRKTQFFKTC